MGTYGFEPGQFRDVSVLEYIPVIFLFLLLYVAYYSYLRFLERRGKIIIDDNEHEVGDEIDYNFHGNVMPFRLIIRKVSDTEWMAFKLFRSGKKVSLRKGHLRKIIDYMNGNFGFNDEVIGF